MNCSDLKPHPVNLKIYGQNQNVDDLVASISERGVLNPLIIDQYNQIIDGTRRWMACLRLNISEVPTISKVYNSEEEVLSDILAFNRYRIKTPRQIYNEAKRMWDIEKSKARERIRKGKLAKSEGSVRDIVAKYFNMSHSKLKQLMDIFDQEERYPELVARLEDGTWSIFKTWNKIREREIMNDPEVRKSMIMKELDKIKDHSLKKFLTEKFVKSQEPLEKVLNEIRRYHNDNLVKYEKILRECKRFKKYNAEIKSWKEDPDSYLVQVIFKIGNQNLCKISVPGDTFKTFEEANEFASKFQGYCEGRDLNNWIIYLNPDRGCV